MSQQTGAIDSVGFLHCQKLIALLECKNMKQTLLNKKLYILITQMQTEQSLACSEM